MVHISVEYYNQRLSVFYRTIEISIWSIKIAQTPRSSKMETDITDIQSFIFDLSHTT